MVTTPWCLKHGEHRMLLQGRGTRVILWVMHTPNSQSTSQSGNQSTDQSAVFDLRRWRFPTTYDQARSRSNHACFLCEYYIRSIHVRHCRNGSRKHFVAKAEQKHTYPTHQDVDGRVVAGLEFVWQRNLDDMVASRDASHAPNATHRLEHEVPGRGGGGHHMIS